MSIKAWDEEQDYFPIWGTCQGFESLAFVSDGHRKNLIQCSSIMKAMPVDVTEEYYTSRIYKKMPLEISSFLTSEDVTMNYHSLCLTPEKFYRNGSMLPEFWNLLSTNFDTNGVEFVSMVEAKNYPIWGVQFHPEKPVFEWDIDWVNRSLETIISSTFLANFFVDECRKSDHRFDSVEEEEDFLIYNFNPVYTGKGKVASYSTQLYLF